MQLDKSF